MYKFKTNIDTKDYETYLKNCSNANFMQDYKWAKVKSNFNNILCGIYENDKLIGACSILIRNLGFGLKLMYIPRGPLLNLEDKKLISFFKENIYKLAKENKCYVVTIEPNFCNNEISYKEINEHEKVNIPINYSNNWKIKHQNLLDNNFVHQGFTKELDKTFQPRYNMVISLTDLENNVLTPEEIRTSFKAKHRQYIGPYQEKRGVYYKRITDKKDLKLFMQVINETEKRQNIFLRKINYFETIFDTFKDKAVFLLGYVDLNKYLEYLENNKGKESEINDVKNLLKDNKNLLLGASLTILPSNNEGIKMSEYIYAGNDLRLSNLKISMGMIYEVIKISTENKCHYCNLGGVDGNLKDNLTIYKSKFNTIVFEYIGEYDLIINKFKYIIAKKGIPLAKKIRHIIKKKK